MGNVNEQFLARLDWRRRIIMPKVLVVDDSRTGNAAEMAKAVTEA